MDFSELLSHPGLLLAIVLPVTYFILKDIFAFFRERNALKRHKKTIIESEKRILELIKQSDQNKVELLNQLSSLKNKIDGSISEIDDKINDEKEKP
tara:strand:- start:20261 stop:20548 length:288 start_codon:yes stop_codon:yes gene_type:complete